MTREEGIEFLSTPSGFAKGVLGFDLHGWQASFVNETKDLHGRKKLAISTPNGAGKSSKVITTIVLRTLAAKPQAKVVVTSGDYRQISSQVWPAVERHRAKFGGPWTWREHDHYIETPRGGFCTMFTTDDPSRAEGFHAEFATGIDSPCVIICDEAKSVGEGIFEAFSARCTFNILIYISSTGLMLGSFYRAMCGKGGFKRYSIGLADCPHIPQQRIDELLEEYKDNLDHPLLRSTLYGEFMDFEGDRGRFVTLKDIQSALRSPPERRGGDVVAFCDFAGGGAENVLAIRRGNHVSIVRCWKEVNEMAAIGQFIMLFREHNLRPHEIIADNAGAGKPMVNRFHEVGWPIGRFNGQAGANRDSDFSDRNAEVWELAGREIKRGRMILPDDGKLHEQMTNRFRTADSKGRLKCESKDDMRERGVESPDRADAVLAAIAIKPPHVGDKADGIIPSWTKHLEELYEQETFNIPGADLGYH